jgi:glycosyltransferase involved in cell wall biosynthesis
MNSSILTHDAWESQANAAAGQCLAPAVTVLVSLYNYAPYIKGCLESVRASKTDGLPGGFEVIVIDDASTDDSAAVVGEFLAASALPIRLVKKKVNSGVADTRNLGLLLARAPFIFILDADNEIRPDCLAAHYRTIAGSDYAVVYGTINRFDNATRQSIGTVSEGEWDVRKLTTYNYIDAMAMIRKDAVLRVGGYSIEYGEFLSPGWEDYDLWLKLAQAGYSGKHIPQVLSDYRVHPTSMINGCKPFQRPASAYKSRKFFALSKQCPGTELLYAEARGELARLEEKPHRLPVVPEPPSGTPPRRLHQLLGKKWLNSLNKRLAAFHHWLNKSG